ncbi:MAG: amidohydrolase [Spirochaetaceae bacterium]|nr:amidohydrolase [Myxococcales bacterium]MCB9725017.1 amidohydrolase [Spirochaetaceae bacterium]
MGDGNEPETTPRRSGASGTFGVVLGSVARRAAVAFVGITVAISVTIAWGVNAADDAPGRRVPSPAVVERLDAEVEGALPGLLETYRDLHAHPERSLEEERTARVVARSLRRTGYAVETGIGGHGVVGVLRNGEGPTLLLRGDMDALPVTEETGLTYASRVRVTNEDGAEVGVMHACGHDVHTTNLLGTAALLAALRDDWRGTLVVLAQPAEELGRGALMMIEDGLFDRIPRPDHGLALHVAGELPVGTLGYVSGWAAANVDAVTIRVFGRGGHGARPHQANDPVVTAAQIVLALQTLVSRRVDPAESAVVTVGSIQGGTVSNVIPDEVRLELTVRSYTDEVRRQLLDGIAEIATGTCAALGCPRPPEVSPRAHYTPALYNDPALVDFGVALFRDWIGEEAVREIEPTMTGEDFSRYAREGGFPTFLYRLGSVDPARFAAAEAGGEPLPSLHSSRYAPAAEGTLRMGLRSMGRLAIGLLGAPAALRP